MIKYFEVRPTENPDSEQTIIKSNGNRVTAVYGDDSASKYCFVTTGGHFRSRPGYRSKLIKRSEAMQLKAGSQNHKGIQERVGVDLVWGN